MTKTPIKSSQKSLKKQEAEQPSKSAGNKKQAEKLSAKKTKAKLAKDQTLGDYAHAVIAKQYQRLVKQEAGVLQDTDPESLHQMRVGTRRLRTALQIFGEALKLPKPARDQHVRSLTKVLGLLRDLDVQMAALEGDYRPQLPPSEQEMLDRAITSLRKQRVKAFSEVEAALTQSEYRNLKTAYEKWVAAPEFTPLAELPLETALPDILSPLLSELLLHSGWLIAAHDQSTNGSVTLHELRKTCKQARYQAEFFTDFYTESFQGWVNELKQLQENLGTVQDTHVLLEVLSDHLPAKSNVACLQKIIRQQQISALADWDQLRTKYLDSAFRRQLYQMILRSD